jgi:hypothetical protein
MLLRCAIRLAAWYLIRLKRSYTLPVGGSRDRIWEDSIMHVGHVGAKPEPKPTGAQAGENARVISVRVVVVVKALVLMGAVALAYPPRDSQPLDVSPGAEPHAHSIPSLALHAEPALVTRAAYSIFTERRHEYIAFDLILPEEEQSLDVESKRNLFALRRAAVDRALAFLPEHAEDFGAAGTVFRQRVIEYLRESGALDPEAYVTRLSRRADEALRPLHGDRPAYLVCAAADWKMIAGFAQNVPACRIVERKADTPAKSVVVANATGADDVSEHRPILARRGFPPHTRS